MVEVKSLEVEASLLWYCHDFSIMFSIRLYLLHNYTWLIYSKKYFINVFCIQTQPSPCSSYPHCCLLIISNAVMVFCFRFYHSRTNINRLLNMVSSLLVSKAKDTISDDIMKNLNVISFSTCIIEGSIVEGCICYFSITFSKDILLPFE